MIVVDCPVPPSVNRLWRIGKDRRTGKRYIYKNPRAARWLQEFWYACRVAQPFLPSLSIEGPFDVEILICPDYKRDADNSAKLVLDAAQQVGLIKNDSQARRVTQELVGRDQAPLGCRLTIKPL